MSSIRTPLLTLALLVFGAMAPHAATASQPCTANCPGGSCSASGFGAKCTCVNGNPDCTNGLQGALTGFAGSVGLAVQEDRAAVFENDLGILALSPIADLANLRPADLANGAIVGVAYFEPTVPTTDGPPEGFYLLRVTDDGQDTPVGTLIDADGNEAAAGPAMAMFIPGETTRAESTAQLGLSIGIHIGIHGDCWWLTIDIRINFAVAASLGPSALDPNAGQTLAPMRRPTAP